LVGSAKIAQLAAKVVEVESNERTVCMNRRELIRAVAAHTGENVKQVEAVVSGMTDVVTAVVAKGETVTVQGFVKFSKTSRPARVGRNPRTGEPIKIKAKTLAKATAMKSFKDTVMAPSKAPRLARGVWPTSPELLARQAEERKAASSSNGDRSSTLTPAVRGVAKKRSATAAPRKAAGRKTGTTAKKAPAKKASVKKAAAKATTRRAPATKASVKKAAVKKAAVRKAAVKATTRRAPAKKSVRGRTTGR